ncbi:MAG: CPXCG motif-containing cysteine-rich protein [Thermoanaerobaculia bacterium]|nr:CPXCG motif-containing cysteine-rich protein [Thermoanaerobaculia bacterium]
MDDFEIPCPWCGETNLISVEADVFGEMIEDCEICCQPIQLNVRRDGWGDPDLDVARA